jgi:hypothetical protein
MAFGIGLAMPQRTNLIASAVPPEEIGVASSVLALVRNIAGAFGIALFATLLTQSTEDAAIALSHNTIVNSLSPLVKGQAIALITLKAQILAYHTTFIVAALILVVASILALFTLKVHEDKSGAEIFVE